MSKENSKSDKLKNSPIIFVICSILILIVFIAVLIKCGIFNKYEKEIEIFFSILTSSAPVITSIAAIFGIYLLNKRVEEQQKQTKNQTKQIDLQIEHKVDDRFNEAIKLLGSSETSARTGGIYILYNLFIKEKKYRRQIANILCSHIRSKTKEPEYQKNHKSMPSNEIQTCIDLIFKNSENRKGIYSDYKNDVDTPNLRRAFLQGANFYKAKCQGVDFINAKCQGAYFEFTEFQNACFIGAKCQGANFIFTKFQGVNFRNAKCQGAIFFRNECQGANFTNAEFQGADFEKSNFQGAFALENCYDNLEKRIGKNTELEDITFIGRFSDEDKKDIEEIKKYDEDLYERLQKIIKYNENIELSNRMQNNKLPDGIITGVLKDSEEIQKYSEKIQQRIKNIMEIYKNS